MPRKNKQTPWDAVGLSKSTYYRKQKKEKETKQYVWRELDHKTQDRIRARTVPIPPASGPDEGSPFTIAALPRLGADELLDKRGKAVKKMKTERQASQFEIEQERMKAQELREIALEEDARDMGRRAALIEHFMTTVSFFVDSKDPPQPLFITSFEQVKAVYGALARAGYGGGYSTNSCNEGILAS